MKYTKRITIPKQGLTEAEALAQSHDQPQRRILLRRALPKASPKEMKTTYCILLIYNWCGFRLTVLHRRRRLRWHIRGHEFLRQWNEIKATLRNHP